MTDSLPPHHPYWLVRQIAIAPEFRIAALNLSYYKYVPQSLVDERDSIHVSVRNFVEPAMIERLVHDTPDGHELAFHSTVTMTDHSLAHIPLVDMSTTAAAQLEKLRPFLGEDLYGAFSWYRSGRSFHGYASAVISSVEWAALMGRFLLANKKGMAPYVDPRWIGHRLIAGFSALRWTKRTHHYLDLPTAVGAKRPAVKSKMP